MNLPPLLKDFTLCDWLFFLMAIDFASRTIDRILLFAGDLLIGLVAPNWDFCNSRPTRLGRKLRRRFDRSVSFILEHLTGKGVSK